MILLAVICYIFLFIGSVIFCRRYGTRNKLLLMFFTWLNLALISRWGSFIVDISFRVNNWTAPSVWMYSTFRYLSEMFFSSAIIFILLNWSNYIMKLSDLLMSQENNLKKAIVYWGFLLFEALDVIFFGVIIGVNWKYSDGGFLNIDLFNRYIPVNPTYSHSIMKFIEILEESRKWLRVFIIIYK